MTKRQWFLVAGTLVLTACGTGTEVCFPATSQVENQNRDEVGYVVCPNPRGTEPAIPAIAKVDEPGS